MSMLIQGQVRGVKKFEGTSKTGDPFVINYLVVEDEQFNNHELQLPRELSTQENITLLDKLRGKVVQAAFYIRKYNGGFGLNYAGTQFPQEMKA